MVDVTVFDVVLEVVVLDVLRGHEKSRVRAHAATDGHEDEKDHDDDENRAKYRQAAPFEPEVWTLTETCVVPVGWIVPEAWRDDTLRHGRALAVPPARQEAVLQEPSIGREPAGSMRPETATPLALPPECGWKLRRGKDLTCSNSPQKGRGSVEDAARRPHHPAATAAAERPSCPCCPPSRQITEALL